MSSLRMNSTASSIPGYVEDKSKGNMLRYQDSLPRLPVPSLEETAVRYLKSVKAAVSPEQYARTEQVVKDFLKPGSISHELQKRLEAKAADPNVKNWLYEWWNQLAYLTYKDPVVPYVSYFYSYNDDKLVTNPDDRAGQVIVAALKFRDQVVDGSLEPEYMRKQPLCMDSYKYMFNCCRIPDLTADYPKKYDYAANDYIVVIRKNRFFKVPTQINGKRLTAAEFAAQCRAIRENTVNVGPGLGALTSMNRDDWARARSAVLQASPENAAALEAIEAASFVVCLDDVEPVTLEERAHTMWHGDGLNRFYDKPLQFIVTETGSVGFMGEHSMMDGTPTCRLNEYVSDLTLNRKLTAEELGSNAGGAAVPAEIVFKYSPEVQAAIKKAHKSFTETIEAHQVRVLKYDKFGKNLIKKFKCSPDAFVQMCIQLGYYKMFGVCRPTYESAATRKFQLGRTETCRSLSQDSVAFVKAMQDPRVDNSAKVAAARKAFDSHIKYIGDASEGRGVDRHLLGLKLSLKEGEEVPALFKDPSYAYTGSWYLSTSQLSCERFNGYGWSQVIDDGFGIAYMINNDFLNFNICSKHLGSDKLQFYIRQAADDLYEIFTADLAAKSKL
ncbi:hypothetical protein CANCADRAFT_2379 [Tortispora caseinolytica NRRL Y-17796]|uniref:Carnitine O-acetyltransferase, mitochondrial n=1 Tax=Tortispora caseinolytica NRRL Y-17796 TaxID=767744 RepID=A0A1E4TFX6_9ASCO|nr:hypothetical protein CANCADRAFT_2379 [Tortispora caseinolytica NRRL Y-17796]